MKLFQILLGGLLVVACGEENKEGGHVEKTPVTASGQELPVTGAPEEAGQSGAGEGATGDVADLPPLPEVMTKEFIMALWAKPHDERDVIKGLEADFMPGVWKWVRRIGPRKGELVENFEASLISKWVDRRFAVSKFSHDGGVQYSVMTYDYETEGYRWWELLPDGFINEFSGKQYWRELMEWKSVRLSEEGMQMRMRDTIRREKSIKVIVEFKREGELVAYAEDEGTWVSELPEEHRSPVKQ
ncbi:MAG: hypothetical protein CMN03_09390 [Roseibacillus sp.]|nr:hypothetical protein [Roseibacillus sp.]